MGAAPRVHGCEAVCTQSAKLVNHCKAAQNDPIAHMHMSGQLGTVGKDGVIANVTIVCQMNVGHDPIVIAQRRYACIARRAYIEGAKLSNGVAIANDQLARLAGVFFVLGHCAQRIELKYLVVFANGGVPLNDAMAGHRGASIDANMGTNDRVRSYRDTAVKLGSRVDNGS